MNENYAKAYKEVIEILKNIPEESVNKIPKELLDIFKENMDEDYQFSIDIERNFEEQNLMEETKAIFANIFRDYWATPYQKEIILKKENVDRQRLDMEKREKYNPDNLFKNKPIVNEIKEKKEEVSMIVVEEKGIFNKIIKFIKGLFNK